MNTELFRPPPNLSISEWADAKRFLSSEASAEPGRWNTERAPYQRAMMDAVKQNERIVIMTAAQVGKTELLLNTIGYYADQDPSPMLMVHPTLQMGDDFSKNKLFPMLRDTPCLSDKIPIKSRNGDNNILYKKFVNGAYIAIAGANSPAGLASRSIRVLLCDEVDRYPASAGEEGDPLSLAIARTSNFLNRRIILVSTPTVKGISRIEKAFALSTREEWCVPCPNCGLYQPYEWERIIYSERTQPVMRCEHCGHEYGEAEWKSQRGKWLSQYDIPRDESESTTQLDPPPEQPTMRGFHMNAFASPWRTWNMIVNGYHEAYVGGEEQMKTWVNTTLGEPYEIKEGSIDAVQLIGNVEEMPKLPACVEYLTCGVDVQDNRLELEVLAWGPYYETWGVEYRIIYGSPGASEVWETLDEYLTHTWEKDDGSKLGISCTCIDSGGHFTDNVYKFTQTRTRRRIYAIIGRGGFGRPAVSGPTRGNRRRVPLFTLGVSTIKGMLFSRLQAERGEPGFCHFPNDPRTGYDMVYFKGLLSERMVIERKNGQDKLTWEKKPGVKRNEPLDCRVYAMGAYEILNPKPHRTQRTVKRVSDEQKRRANPAKEYRLPVSRPLVRKKFSVW